MNLDIKVGDEVRILTGEYEGRIGKVLEITLNPKSPVVVVGWGILGDWECYCSLSEIEKYSN